MDLSKSIVIVNEFSSPSLGQGGRTPGQYVVRYMAREGASEPIMPVRRKAHDGLVDAVFPIRHDEQDDYTIKYRKMNESCASAQDIPQLKKKIESVSGLAGVAFGKAGNRGLCDVTMSDESLRAISRDIQKLYDEGKTVLETVVSFDTNYLKEKNVVDQDARVRQDGDLRCRFDQMKVRLAIAKGMERLSRRYDDLVWVGIIQSDTKHIHCHLCMADKGEGRLLADGQQKGMLTKTDMKILRSSINESLVQMQNVHSFHLDHQQQKTNVRSFVREYAMDRMREQSDTRLLISCLPEEKEIWDAYSTDPKMKKPNAIAEKYVRSILAKPDSGYERVLLKGDPQQERLIKDCINSIYGILSDLDPKQLQPAAPLIRAMSKDFEQCAAQAADSFEDGLSYRIRSSRLRFDAAKKLKESYEKAQALFEKQEALGNVHPAAYVLLDYYKEEQDYYDRVVAKYQNILRLSRLDQEEQTALDGLNEQRKRIKALENMCADQSMENMSASEAEKYGLAVYHLTNGRFRASNPKILERDLENSRNDFEKDLEDLKNRLSRNGFTLTESDAGYQALYKPAWPFDEVKALDLHHLESDFGQDIRIPLQDIEQFESRAALRQKALNRAREYLELTGQNEEAQALDNGDIAAMSRLAVQLRFDPTLYCVSPQASERTRDNDSFKTISFKDSSLLNIQDAIRQTIQKNLEAEPMTDM